MLTKLDLINLVRLISLIFFFISFIILVYTFIKVRKLTKRSKINESDKKMTIVIFLLMVSMLLKIIETIVKMYVDWKCDNVFMDVEGICTKDFNTRLGHCYIWCNGLFVIAVGLNLNIWITFYIKIGK